MRAKALTDQPPRPQRAVDGALTGPDKDSDLAHPQPSDALMGCGLRRERLDPLVDQLLDMTQKRVGEQAEQIGLGASARR